MSSGTSPSSSPNMEGAGAAGLGRGACPLVLAVAPEEARCVCGPAAAPTEGPAHMCITCRCEPSDMHAHHAYHA
eukprot:scaffold176585_cov24-Tisochrysis_lutea.AAC.1